ncbi:restriction endonuclease [Salmonella enterica subsp. enterica serovar Typhimurium]|uniref:restriction endonuclease n=1 Tax=Salmonella enterica TaxID=28901 RepID=UPI0011572173|nr:restriction endonuclease [Salmonella enterica]ECI3394439.1 restriction endonuclease [Salmonella enterica subsp. enterica serovar Typhimurium]TQS50175.1 restriction endonuclease [Salmonella enterica subsp. enterica serovar Typhimurium]TQS57329.1 restriction endonuclease [Salmonella enterica subsp. enterica serovar Typhimurium]TQS67367.1 restriction endonuclease [Salmonella enterica subsp. enterica serovar Typhimurium]
MMFMVIFLFLLLCFIVVAARGCRRTVSARVRRHRRYRKTAQRVLGRLPQLSSDGARLSYLRKINPYVFEELLLLALEKQGLEVIRNRSYSGDGGLDGQVFINGERWLIQAKRYSRSISPQHVREFGELLAREGCRGFFVHTGRTGRKSLDRLGGYPQIQLVSGRRLLELLARDRTDTDGI